MNVGISKIQNSISSLARFLILGRAPRIEQPSAGTEPAEATSTDLESEDLIGLLPSVR